MTIRLTFPDPADSPTGASPVRVRYSLRQQDGRTVPVLTYSHGRADLTPQAWAGFREAGARLSADTERERRIVAEVLGPEALDG